MRAVTVLAASFLLVACGNLDIRPGEKPHARRDVPSGKGVLTGSQGEFVLFRVEGAVGDQRKEGEQAYPKAKAK